MATDTVSTPAAKKADSDPLYLIHMPDDSLAPKTRKGTELLISYTDKPVEGQGVLLQDRSGTQRVVRMYHDEGDGHWSGLARDPNVPPVRSRDGASVVAVVGWVKMDGAL